MCRIVKIHVAIGKEALCKGLDHDAQIWKECLFVHKINCELTTWSPKQKTGAFQFDWNGSVGWRILKEKVSFQLQRMRGRHTDMDWDCTT